MTKSPPDEEDDYGKHHLHWMLSETQTKLHILRGP